MLLKIRKLIFIFIQKFNINFLLKSFGSTFLFQTPPIFPSSSLFTTLMPLSCQKKRARCYLVKKMQKLYGFALPCNKTPVMPPLTISFFVNSSTNSEERFQLCSLSHLVFGGLDEPWFLFKSHRSFSCLDNGSLRVLICWSTSLDVTGVL